MGTYIDDLGNLHADTMNDYGDYLEKWFADNSQDYQLCKSNKHGWKNVHDHHEDGCITMNCVSDNYQQVAQEWVWNNVPVQRLPYPGVINNSPIMPGGSIDYTISKYEYEYSYNSVTTHMDTSYGVSGTGVTEEGEMSGYYNASYSEDETQIQESASLDGQTVAVHIENPTTDQIWTPEWMNYHWEYTGYIQEPYPEIYYIFDWVTYSVACKFDNGCSPPTVTGWEHYHANYMIHDTMGLEDHVYVPCSLQLNVNYTNPWPYYKILKTDMDGNPIT